MEAAGKSTDRYLNVNQISNYLNRSSGAIRNLVLRRAIPYRKPAGRLLFDREEIDLWIKHSEGISIEELAEKK
jgi:predicted DNA-binding transcriptional regulator AlpA